MDGDKPEGKSGGISLSDSLQLSEDPGEEDEEKESWASNKALC